MESSDNVGVAFEKVLDITELVEAIFMELPKRDLLLGVPGTCKHFKCVIDNSAKLQKKLLFTRPTIKNNIYAIDFDRSAIIHVTAATETFVKASSLKIENLKAINDLVLYTIHHKWDAFIRLMLYDRAPDLAVRARINESLLPLAYAVGRTAESCRKMQITNPPSYRIELTVAGEYFKRETHVITNDKGICLQDLFDVISGYPTQMSPGPSIKFDEKLLLSESEKEDIDGNGKRVIQRWSPEIKSDPACLAKYHEEKKAIRETGWSGGPCKGAIDLNGLGYRSESSSQCEGAGAHNTVDTPAHGAHHSALLSRGYDEPSHDTLITSRITSLSPLN